MSLRAVTGLAFVVLAASGCGLKGPLYLPEKSEVTIRRPPAATPPGNPAPTAPATEPAATPEPAAEPEKPPQDPQAGPESG